MRSGGIPYALSGENDREQSKGYSQVYAHHPLQRDNVRTYGAYFAAHELLRSVFHVEAGLLPVWLFFV